MIRIGFETDQKQAVISEYLQDHSDITKVYVFFFKRFPVALDVGDRPVEYIEYADIIMYKFFYRLLEEINDKSLIVYNECLRAQKRSDLTYNCAHHYSNQTPHNIVFEYFPFIDTPDDSMILVDFQAPGKYKGRGFDPAIIRGEDVATVERQYALETADLEPTEDDLARYERKKDELFEQLGQGDPDTIPRNLHIFAGGMKKKSIAPSGRYVARNARYGLPNVVTYKDIVEPGEYVILDFPHRRLDFNDFLKVSGMTDICFVNSGLPVDLYYIRMLREWMGRIEDFHAQTGLRQ